MLLRSARLANGRFVDVELSDGHIAAVTDPTSESQAGGVDLDGFLLLAAPAEPHAHLDKALTADLVANADGHLDGAIEAWMADYAARTVPEITARARRAALVNVAHGCTAIRTHVDVNDAIGLRAVHALLALRDELRPLVDLQIVALAGRPLAGPEGATNRALLRQALELGVDVGGGCPHVDIDSTAHLDIALEAAADAKRPVDLHMDETLRPDSLDLRTLVRRIGSTGFPHGVVASHCVSLGVQPPQLQRDIAAEVADAGISVVTLPQTNLFLQARGQRQSPPRALTAVRALLDAGANLAAGADNLQDPFNVVGRGDPFETAALLVMAGHLEPAQAYHCVSNAARLALGLAPVNLEPGDPADLLAVRASTVREAVASAPADRVVIRAGKVICRTTATTTFA